MNQDEVFIRGEADRWFARNRDHLARKDRFDWPMHMLMGMPERERLSTVLELGCSNGWRLELLREALGTGKRYVGVDPSEEALSQGREAFPEVEFHHGVLSEVPLKASYDLVIVNYVLHWVDRSSLARSLAEIDRLVAEGGYLLIGDFLPDYRQKRRYHHLADQRVFTFKQDYPGMFLALGTYAEVARVTHDQAGMELEFKYVASGDRGVCALLRKSLGDYYPEAT